MTRTGLFFFFCHDSQRNTSGCRNPQSLWAGTELDRQRCWEQSMLAFWPFRLMQPTLMLLHHYMLQHSVFYPVYRWSSHNLSKTPAEITSVNLLYKGYFSSIWSRNHVIYMRLICPYFTCLILIKEQMTITIAVRYCWGSHAIVLRERGHRLFSLITFQIVFESSYKKYTVRAP